MLVMQKRQSTFIKKSDSTFGKDAYYRLLIIDDIVEAKRGKLIEGSCKYGKIPYTYFDKIVEYAKLIHIKLYFI